MLTNLVKVFALLGLLSSSSAARLSVSGSSLMYNGDEVFLNGVNIAWNNYGYDFGNGGYDGTLDTWLQDIGNAGGNAVRIWVHVEGYSTPAFDSDGYVTACDTTGDFINDITTFLDSAQANGILVILTLWNGAYMTYQPGIDLFYDADKLDSYINNCLSGFASAVAGHPALGAWEAINEPEGSVLIASDANPCYDTTILGSSGAGWTGKGIPMQNFLTFIGKLNQAIRANDPEGLTTVGSWTQYPQNDAFENSFNYYSDDCLNGAAGGSGAGLDFYQMHAYAWGDDWSPDAPFTVSAADYLLDRPIVIGEYASVCGDGTSLADLNEYAYDNGYSGGLSWHWVATGDCSDTREVQSAALGQLVGRTENGVVDIVVG